ncbi:MmcQ/YjbR family DNA-binding protein [Vibrio sp.]|uniref:MmcQ/YjbR family DNA-binding protein n=1 Tax=Vibrio viridaestus TaxID=2487322 RepID=A0A3N9U195_9VIBR|nr:MmcQ/YjbR family DNA-binding protein [Vibrio viridaestus]MDC0611510.1 MmcQ/YjbR family DNA-binding protein [Vibrio sp.]RQW63152.1 MmcQ/YjbR family DNA-binding protein [Vibrio viridaestus]
MNHSEFNFYCSSLPSVTHVVQWGNSEVWKVGGKVFAIGTKSKQGDDAYTFKVSERNFHFLRESEGYIPAPYFASRGMLWIQMIESVTPRDEELKYYLSESYRLVVAGLSKKARETLGLTISTE